MPHDLFRRFALGGRCERALGDAEPLCAGTAAPLVREIPFCLGAAGESQEEVLVYRLPKRMPNVERGSGSRRRSFWTGAAVPLLTAAQRRNSRGLPAWDPSLVRETETLGPWSARQNVSGTRVAMAFGCCRTTTFHPG